MIEHADGLTSAGDAGGEASVAPEAAAPAPQGIGLEDSAAAECVPLHLGGAGQLPEFAGLVGKVMWVRSRDATIRDGRGAEVSPAATLRWGRYVRVVAVTRPTSKSKELATVLPVASPDAATGEAVVRTRLANLAPLCRPPLPSSAAAQRARLIERARQGRATGGGSCYKAFKLNVIEIGGYGDLLDLYQDERFKTFGALLPNDPYFDYNGAAAADAYYTVPAKHFDECIRSKGGPEAFGLAELTCHPFDAPPGTILVTRGVGGPEGEDARGTNGINMKYGDIAVIAGPAEADLPDALRWSKNADAVLLDDDLAPLTPKEVVPLGEAVWVMGPPRVKAGKEYLEVARTDGAGPVETLGWTRSNHLRHSKPRLVAFNYGKLEFEGERDVWTSGKHEHTLIGMCVPVDRA